MKIGYLNKRIDLLENRPTALAGGGQEDNYVVVTSIWANVAQKGGATPYQAGQVEHIRKYNITMRYRDITHADRISYRGRQLKITSIRNIDEQDRFTELSCEEVV